METHWDFRQTEDRSRWQLVLYEKRKWDHPVWVPGYESKDPGDIIQAFMFLNEGFRGPRLTDRMVSILEDIRAEAESLVYWKKNT